MDFENKIISREVSQLLWEMEKTVGTAESCTGGRIAEAIISVPGSSKYFKGGIVCYVDEIKERLLGVDPQLLADQGAVCEEVAVSLVKGACAMVKGAIKALNVDFAVATTGVAGPGGGTAENPVGTIWIACGSKDRVMTAKLEEDFGRDINLSIATSKVMQMFLEYLNEEYEQTKDENNS